jgi:xanthine dehydrogenase large subunit
MNTHTPNLHAERIQGGVHESRPHDSAHKHVAGTAVYIDDMPEPRGTLHGALGLATVAYGRILSLDLGAVRTTQAWWTCSRSRISPARRTFPPPPA